MPYGPCDRASSVAIVPTLAARKPTVIRLSFCTRKWSTTLSAVVCQWDARAMSVALLIWMSVETTPVSAAGNARHA